MPLKIWLPLNNNLNNIGLSPITLSSGTATYTSGKLGQCLSTGTLNFTLPSGLVSTLGTTKQYSMCCWLKNLNTSTAARWVFLIGSGSGATRGLWEHNTSTSRHWAYNGTGQSITCSINPIDGNWHHLVFTVNNNTVKLYIDGIYQNQITSTAASELGGANVLQLNATDYNLNDFRLYDHCLSAKEVREISQGLILHYKLNGLWGGAGDNMAYGTNTASTSTNTWRLGLQTGGTSNSIEYDVDGTPVAVITRDSVEWTGWSYLHYDNIHSADIKTSTTYTISFDVKTSVDGTIDFLGLRKGDSTNIKTASTSVIQGTCTANTWSHIVVRGVTKADFTDISDGQVIYFSCSSSLKGTGVTLKMKNMKMEEGPNATLWVPALSETGISTTSITDSSGYNNSGIITGVIPTNSNSNRYKTSMTFSGNCANYIANVGFPKITKDITFSCWAYQTSETSTSGGDDSNNSQYLISQGRDWVCSGFNLKVSAGTAVLDIGVSSTSGSSLWSGTSILNDWHMVTGTFDGTNMKIYIDGILKGTKNPGVTEIDYTYGGDALVVGKMSYGYTSSTSYFPFAGYINDVRVYATALSADDILDLYHTSANVDNLQNIHCFELQENGEISSILKNGIMTTDEFHESNSTKLSSSSGGSWTPLANTQNSTTNFAVIDLTDFGGSSTDVKIHIEADVSWTAFTAGTGGTFQGLWFQGANYEIGSTSNNWNASNYITSALNTQYNLRTASAVTTAGNYHYDTIATVPSSWLATYDRSNLGMRCDYSDGTGTVTVSNLKVTPLKYYDARIGSDFIQLIIL